MPITRELTQDELDGLEKEGIDSSSYKGRQLTLYTPSELQQQEQSSTSSSKDVSQLQTVGRTLEATAGGEVGGGVGALSGGTLGGAAVGTLLEPGIGTAIGAILGATLGSAGGSYAGQKLQNTIQGPDTTARLQQDYEEAAQQHPYTALATDIVASALASGGKPNLSNIPKALSGDAGAIGKIAFNAAVNPAINTGLEYATTGQLPSGKDIAAQALGGSLFSESARWASRLTGHGGEPAGEPKETVNQGNTPIPGTSVDGQSQQVPTSPFTMKDENGNIVIDNTAVRQQFDKIINPKPNTSGMNPEQEYQSMIPYRNKQTFQPDEMRDALHEQFIKSQANGQESTTTGSEPINAGQVEKVGEGNAADVTPQVIPNTQLETSNVTDKNKMQTEEVVPPIDKTEQQQLLKESGTYSAPPNDREQYDATHSKMLDMVNKGDVSSPEFLQNWKNMESIKNRNGGMPPPITQAKVGDLTPLIRSGKATVGDILSNVKDDKYAPISKYLLENGGNSLKQPVYETLGRSEYDPVNKQVNLNTDHFDSGYIANHEAAHALTSDFIDKNPNHPLVQQLESLRQIAETHLGKEDYGIKNVHEFIAESLSNKDFQTKLNDVEVPGTKKSIWKHIVDVVRNILGVPIKDGSLLEHSLKATDELIKTANNGEEEVNGLREKRSAPPSSNTQVIPKTSHLGKVGDITRSMIDKIRDIAHPASGNVADAFAKTLNERDQRWGATGQKILEAAKRLGLTHEDKKQLQAISDYENLHGKQAPDTMFRTPEQRQMYNIERQVYRESGAYRLANGEPVYRNGQPTNLRQDQFAHPMTPNPKVVETYKTNTDGKEIARLDKLFLDNAQHHGLSVQESQNALDQWKKGVQGNVRDTGGNLQFYNAARRAQGIPIPREFSRPDYLQNLEAYYHRQATDNTFYKNIEANPKVWSSLGETKDAWNRPIPKDPTGGIAGNSAVKAQLKEFQGETGGQTMHNEKSLSSLVTSLFIASPALEIHKMVTNILGVTNYADNPYQIARQLGHMITNLGEGVQRAKENGITKLTARSFSDFMSNNATFAERLQSLSQGIRNITSIGGKTDEWSSGLMQTGMEYALPRKIQQAASGDISAQQLLKKLDPDYTIGKTYNPDGIGKLASIASNYIHGSHDGRTMPAWMSSDSEFSGFFKLAHWSIAQTNRFYSDIYTPALSGNYAPLVHSIFGAAIGGYLIRQIREELQGKRGQIPSLSEIANSDRGLSGNKGLLFYNLMASAQYAGFGGLLSQVAKYPLDFIYKNSPQGSTFPLDETISSLGGTLKDVSAAIANDPNINWGELTSHVFNHIMTSSVQMGRMAYNQGINSGLITGMVADKKLQNDKMGKLRRFNMAEGLPYNDIDTASDSQFMNLEQKKFKQTQDPQEAAQMLPGLMHNIIKTYGDKPDIMMQKIKSLKDGMTYDTFPSMETTPLSFYKYLSYLKRSEGDEAANGALMDYMKHKMVNEVKGSLVP